MAWPHPPDYNEAVQNPQHCFGDPELQQAQPSLNPLGLPWPRSGNNADVYKLARPGGHAWAVKCFTREVHGLRERYQAVSNYLKRRHFPFLVDFHYLEQGIRVHGQWYPVVKMRWVEGLMLNELVRDYAGKPLFLERLADMWVRLSQEMRAAQFDHGDLQHGNVLLVPGSSPGRLRLRLIDYDGVTVPALAQHPPDEVGHPNYQHPQRRADTAAEPDRFSHLVIYSAVRCLVLGGAALWERYDNGENLLFREADFRTPAQSPLFRELWDTRHPVARSLVGHLIQASQGPPEQVPLLSEIVVNGQMRFLEAAELRQVEDVLGGAQSSSEAAEGATRGGTLPELIAALRDADPRIRDEAAIALGALGPAARPAIPVLRELLNDADGEVRHSAAQALWAIDPLP
jgi:hypothetical protein